MNDGRGGRRGLRPRWWQRAGLLAIVARLAGLTAACSGSSPSPRPGPGAYSVCLRQHGVTGFFAAPPPTSFRSHNAVPVPAKAAAAVQACHSLALHSGQLLAGRTYAPVSAGARGPLPFAASAPGPRCPGVFHSR
jgi:hypothetical protein